MPRTRIPSSLLTLCLQNIAENMQSVWVSDYSEKYIEEYSFLYIEGPFNQLAGSMVQELLRILGESHRVTRASLHLLLQPHLTELSLRPCAGLVSNAIIQLITVRCRFLTFLDLHSCQRVPAASLALLLEGLPQLVKLCLSDTHTNDSVLSAIGSCCQKLRELDISNCKKLTPSSLLHLVYDPCSATYCCQSLRVLLVEGVKPRGSVNPWLHALCFILLAIPRLEQLFNTFLPSALLVLQDGEVTKCGNSPPGFPSLLEVAHARAGCGVQAKVENGSSGKCSAHGGCLGDGAFQCLLMLKKLEDIEEKDLLWATSRCPMAEDITISLDNYSGISSHLTQWPYLTRLTLHCSGPPSRSLEELLTSLEHVGSRLRYLSLQNLFWHQEGSFSTLLSLCPNLHTLLCHFTPRCRTLSHNEPEPELRPWDDNLVIQTLSHLQNFSLLMEGGDPLNPLFKHSVGGSLVSLMCGSPQLQTISLWELPILLDDVFEVMASFSPVPLRKLRTVSLCRSYITSWGATLLLRSDNELETMDLSHCQEITCRDHHRLIEWVRKEGLDITITWQ